MAKECIWVSESTQGDNIGFIGDIQNIHACRCLATVGAAASEENFLARIRTGFVVVHNAVMGVFGIPTCNKHGRRRIWLQIVNANTVCATTHSVQIARLVVDDHGVGGQRTARGDAWKLGDNSVVYLRKVEHLNAATSLTDSVGVCLIGLHVAPQTG